MKKTGLAIVIFLVQSAILPAVTLAAEEPAGKIVILKGKAERTTAGATKAAPIKEGAPIFEGDTIATSADARVKLVLKDESEIVLPASSKFQVESFSKEEKTPSVLSVFVGSLRAKVTKSAGGDTKMLVKTPSATMGVRGTDFQAIYNEKTKMTSLVTFEGQVAMAKLDSPADATPGKMLDALRDQGKTVVVTEGQYSGIAPAQEQPTVPVKISTAQLESMKNSAFAAPPSGAPGAPSAAASGEKKMMSPIPPGVDAKLVTGTLEEFKAMYGKTAGAEAFEPAELRMGGPGGPYEGGPGAPPPPEGFFDAASGRMAPPAGGFIDMNTGLYIPPPPGSAFDPIAGVFVPPPNMGSFNPDTGAYIPPKGFMLDATKGFVPVNAPQPPTGSLPAGEAGHEKLGMVFAGMNQKDFGGDMTAAPPPPGMDPGMFMGAPAYKPPSGTEFFVPGAGGTFPGNYPGGEFPPGAFPPGTGPEYGGYFPGGDIPFYNGPQPNFPVYDPYLCPPYCDPEHQPGGTTGDTTNTNTSATTAVTFIIN